MADKLMLLKSAILKDVYFHDLEWEKLLEKKVLEKYVQAAMGKRLDEFFDVSERIHPPLLRVDLHWRPDVVWLNSNKDKIVIVELKGKPSSSTMDYAISQVCGYADSLIKFRPDVPIESLIVIGPWKTQGGKKHLVHSESYGSIPVYVYNFTGIADTAINTYLPVSHRMYADPCIKDSKIDLYPDESWTEVMERRINTK